MPASSDCSSACWSDDGKPEYLPHLPRVWRMFERALRHEALQPLRTWVDRLLPPELRHGELHDRRHDPGRRPRGAHAPADRCDAQAADPRRRQADAGAHPGAAEGARRRQHRRQRPSLRRADRRSPERPRAGHRRGPPARHRRQREECPAAPGQRTFLRAERRQPVARRAAGADARTDGRAMGRRPHGRPASASSVAQGDRAPVEGSRRLLHRAARPAAPSRPGAALALCLRQRVALPSRLFRDSPNGPSPCCSSGIAPRPKAGCTA